MCDYYSGKCHRLSQSLTFPCEKSKKHTTGTEFDPINAEYDVANIKQGHESNLTFSNLLIKGKFSEIWKGKT